MKFSLVAVAALVASAEAITKPSLTISVTDGSFDGADGLGVDGLNPTLTWKGSSSAGDIDIDYGIESAVRPTTDIASLPRKIFGTVKTNVAGWGVSAKGEKDLESGSTDLEVNANNEDIDLSVALTASVDGGVDSISATKNLDVDGKTLKITPRYRVADEDADVVIKYDAGDTNVELTASRDSQEVVIDHTMDKTNIKLTASADNQEVTVSQQIDDDNRIAPTINRNGDISLEWERKLGDDNTLTATLKPNESIDVEWKDDAWTAEVKAGLDGSNISGLSISTKREVLF